METKRFDGIEGGMVFQVNNVYLGNAIMQKKRTRQAAGLGVDTMATT